VVRCLTAYYQSYKKRPEANAVEEGGFNEEEEVEDGELEQEFIPTQR
jgi:hypothetical protein